MILLVDGEPFALEMVKRKLSSVDYKVETATNVQTAIALMEVNQELKVIMTDLHFSDGTGLELLEWTEKNRPDIHRVVFSAQIYEGWLRDEGHKSLCEYVLAKPGDLEKQLMPMLDKLLGKER